MQQVGASANAEAATHDAPPAATPATRAESAKPGRHRPQLPTQRTLEHRRTLARTVPLMVAAMGAVAFAAISGVSGLDGSERALLPVRNGLDRVVERFGFGITQVDITGYEASDPADILERVNGDGARSLIGLQPHILRARIEALPWIDTATITRVWPDRLSVAVTERVPFAVALDARDAANADLIDRTGRKLTRVRLSDDLKLPRVVGEGAADHAARIVDAVGKHPDLAGLVTAYARVDGRRWDLVFRNGGRARLPSGSFEGALAWLAHAGRAAKLNAHAVVDLRAPGRAAVRVVQAASLSLRAPQPILARANVNVRSR
ncbi:MAG: FtsQ-type POTRA domain-containing protein [Pseudomonadota bacterium]